MSDEYRAAAGLPVEPYEIHSPPPADPERLFADHDKLLENYNEHDPQSIFYRRPDLAARARAEAQLQFDAALIRAGVPPRAPITAQQLAEKQFNQEWSMKMPDGLVAELNLRIEAASAMSTNQREEAIAAFKRDLGEERWAHLAANTLTRPSMDQKAFIAQYGEMEHAKLVKFAKASLMPGEKWNEAIAADRYTLITRANFGKYNLAREQFRPR